ncbi:MAG: helix-turn-helix transcriptional regulator [Clostridia bacterium]|nr:helix-turn-helix transcriptional regulator [Clostridia bacterium]
MFKENLKQLRIEMKFTQTQLAKLLNVSFKTISHWENGYSEPNIQQIILLKNLFKVSYEEILE